jgi:TolB-like protein
MKKVILLICITAFAWVGNMQAQDRMKIAVMDFKAGAGVEQSEVTGISSILTTYLNDTKKFTIVERTQIDEVISEQGFQYSSLTNRQMIKLGEILNAQKIVVGDVNIVGGQYNIDARILDVETGNMDSGAGEMWVKGTSYREVMRKVAQTLVLKMDFPVSQSTPAEIANPNKGKVVTLYNYLHVYPEDLGSFPSVPNTVINAINSDAPHGYNDWRIPTTEEMALIKANRSKIYGLASGEYMTSDGTRSGNVRLVSTGVTLAEQEKQQQEEAIRLALEAELKKQEIRLREQILKEEPNTWNFEIASNDITSVEARNKESACPSGWRLPRYSEMAKICSNPYVAKLLNGSTYWIAGSEIKHEAGYIDWHNHDYTKAEQYAYEETYLIVNAYSISNCDGNSKKIHIHHRSDAYTDRWGKWHDASDYDITSNPIYYPCRCVRNKIIEEENTNIMPPYAVSTKTWVFGSQTWSDAIQVPACNKETFEETASNPDCRNYIYEGKTYYYYNWPYVKTNAAQLCPAPWRVPYAADFASLASIADHNNLVDVWGLGGAVTPTGIALVRDLALLWSVSQAQATDTTAAYYKFNAGSAEVKYLVTQTGMQVRCVK